jgi:hypothetical protein
VAIDETREMELWKPNLNDLINAAAQYKFIREVDYEGDI